MRVEDLVVAEQRGDLPSLLLFWGHRAAGGDVGPWCLSQWWAQPFTVDEVMYPTAEHWMMAAKARLFDDLVGEAAILSAKGPQQAKAAGRLVRGFTEQTWFAHRYQIVVRGNLAKFSQNAALRDYLLSTNPYVLVEASPYDRVWGIGLSATAPAARSPNQWRGANLLGFALMDVRAQLLTSA